MPHAPLIRFVLELLIDESFFEKVGKRNVFRYRPKSVFVPFRAKNAQNAKRLVAGKIEEYRKKESLTSFSLIDARLYRSQFLPLSALRRRTRKKEFAPSH